MNEKKYRFLKTLLNFYNFLFLTYVLSNQIFQDNIALDHTHFKNSP